MSKTVRRLYEQFVPEHYRLTLDIDPDSMTFSGTVTIVGRKAGRPSRRLTFHQNGLCITKAKVFKKDKKGIAELNPSRINHHSSFNEVRLHFSDMVFPGEYEVSLEFEGKITRPMNGIYPCYFKHGGKDDKLIATQFESHHAREAFPCIDEPEAKATFDLTLLTPKIKSALANTPVKSQQSKAGKLLTEFETTPKMSTYLLAFVFGDLEFLEAKTKDGTLVRTYATPDNVKFTKFALDNAVKILEFYNDYFDIPYPLVKCDLIALPDFASGAMENWGCITFREQTLLVDPKNTSLSVKQYVAMVVAHELAHQWFGNLVTMRWWNDLWLNEGFASWIEYLAVDHLFPDWKMWTQFIVNEQEQAFRLDALEHTHPIEVAVHHPDEIHTIFDTVSYCKGSSVLHMLNNYLGKESFRDGLREYLKTHAYGNTETVDLWQSLESISKKPVKDFMHVWITQAGYPIVVSKLTGAKQYLLQERFYLNQKADTTQTIWPVPLLASGIEFSADTLEQKRLDFDQPSVSGSALINHERSGFFRVIYNAEHVEELAAQIKVGNLSELDRVGLLSDASEAAKAGYGSTTSALKLLAAYSDEESSVVWDIIAGGLGSIRGVMNDEELREGMKPFCRKLVARQLKRLGWKPKENESYFDRLLRPTILSLASISDEKSVVDQAMTMFAKMKKPEDIDPDLRGLIYGTAARNGDKNEFDKMLAMHNTSQNSEERVTLSAAMTNFKQPEIIAQALAMIRSDNVRLQDASYWIAYSFMNRFARDDAWHWMTKNWSWMEENLGSDLSFYRLPIYSARAYSDSKFLPTYKNFFDKHKSPTLARAINQGIETIQWQSAWRERDLIGIKKFFDKSNS